MIQVQGTGTDTIHISMVGRIWMPAITCAMDYTARMVPYGGDCYGDDLEAPERGLPEDWRNAVASWLAMHAGDFQSVDDFRAVLPDRSVIPWASEDGEIAYWDCMSED